MFIKRITATAIVLTIVSFSVFAQNNDSDKVKSILFMAKDSTEKASFKSKTSNNYDGKVVDNIIYRTYMNGTLLDRHEQIVDGVVKEIVISNHSGIYYFNRDGKFAIKNEIKMLRYNRALGFNYMLDKLDWNYNCSYSMTEDKFNGIPCYKIIMKSPDDEGSMAKMINKSVQYIRDNKAFLQFTFLATRVFWVGQNNNFIYSYAFYNPKGEIIYSRTWGKIEFLNKIDENLFAIPKGITPVTVKSPEKMKEVCQKLAEQGDAEAQFNLGCCYENGDGVAKDKSEAVKWYRKAAEKGLVDAQRQLGRCYEKGNGVAKDEDEAKKWYKQANEQRARDAQSWRYWQND